MLVSLGFWALAATFIPTSQGAVHQIVAGDPSGGSPEFRPPTLSADAGDTIIFTFTHRHTVTKAGFDRPCNNGTAAYGFDSGFLNPGDKFFVNVTSTDPIWIRCNGNCADGMVAAINSAESGNLTYEQYRENALATNGFPTTSTLGGPSYPTSAGSSSHGAATSRSPVFHPTAIISGIIVLALSALAL